MALCSTKKRVIVKPRPNTESRDSVRLGLGTPHVIPETLYPEPKYLFSSKQQIFLNFLVILLFIDKEESKTNKKMGIQREEPSQKLCYFSIHICHLTCNFGYFCLKILKEPIQIQIFRFYLPLSKDILFYLENCLSYSPLQLIL